MKEIANTNANSGFLSLSTAPTEREMEDALHEAIAGITGLGGDLIRPRFQIKAVKSPAKNTSWCAFGITQRRALISPTIISKSEYADTLLTHEEVNVLVSFYGPEANSLAMSLRDGLMIAQNRASLRKAGFSYTRADATVNLPEIVNMEWRARCDLPLVFLYETRRNFAVSSIKEVAGTIITPPKSLPPILETEESENNIPGIKLETGCNACNYKCYQKKPVSGPNK